MEGLPESWSGWSVSRTASFSRKRAVEALSLLLIVVSHGGEGNENIVVGDATECARDGQSGAVPVDSIILRDRIARREWRSDLPTVLPIRSKRLEIFPKDIQKRVSEAKRMGTLPDLSAMLAAQLGLASEEGPSATVPRIDEVPPSGGRNAGKGEWRSDLPTVLPIRTKRLDIFPKDIQKRVSEAKRMGTLPDLSAMLAAQLGLASEEGPSTTVPRIGEVPPSGARNAGKGKKWKRGSSGVERNAEEASDVPPSGEPQKKKKKKKKKRTEKPADEQSENPKEPTENEEGDVQEEELQPEDEASEAEISGELDDAVEVGEREESEIPLNAARPDGSEEDSGESPLLIRRWIVPRSGEVHASPAARESSVRASELSALNDRESDQEA
ncbi:hypothetical protein DY000_02006136 [Brassica cretica]|uniref:Uncharacterized protein n=1 Tax=Brassica cretica TaxID=69181 RepID=A0ABQ7BTK3_BRACR|nr:hypothetical protein DY000_02006136 [Brassica cretica]